MNRRNDARFTPDHAWLVLAACLGAAACLQPDLLYVLALGLFGLPHICWKMGWVARCWSRTTPRAFWVALGGALGLQGWARMSSWSGRIDASTAAALDLMTLALALLAVLVLAWRVRSWRGRATLALAAALAVLVHRVAGTPLVLPVLAMLAIAHNFTPIGLVPGGARIGGWPARAVFIVLFAAPVVLFASRWALHSPLATATAPRPGEWVWVDASSRDLAAALLPALVWSQCLHYLAVMVLVPRAMGRAWPGLPARPLALAASAGLMMFFMVDFSSARGLYAVASGMHAWLEWPLLLLVAAGMSPTTGNAESDAIGARPRRIESRR